MKELVYMHKQTGDLVIGRSQLFNSIIATPMENYICIDDGDDGNVYYGYIVAPKECYELLGEL